MKRAWSAVVAAIVTLALLALALRRVHPRQLWLVLSGAGWRWLPAMMAIALLDLVIRAVRWKVLLSRSGAKATVRQLFELEAIGLSVNNVLPFRAGELARAFLAARELSLPAATTLASVAVERALDVAALLTLFSAAAAYAPALVPEVMRRLALLTLGAAVAALIVLAAAERPLSLGGAWEARLRPWPRLHDLVVQLAAGAAVLRSAAAAAQAIVLSLLLWGVDALFYWVGGRALGIGNVLDYGRSVLVLSWAGAASVLPTAPGGFGAYEAAVAKIVGSLGVDADRAFAYAVFNHMVPYLWVSLVGLACLYHVGLSLTELRSAIEKRPAA